MKKWIARIVVLTMLLVLTAGCNRGEPVAAFTADIQEGDAPLKVFFEDRSTIEKSLLDTESLKALFLSESTPKAQIIESWKWDFGDGETCTAQHTYHTYDTPGDYTVLLVVETNKGKKGHVEKKNFITVLEPEAVVEGESTEGEGDSGEGEIEEGELEEGEGSDSCNPDVIPPVITLFGAPEVSIECGAEYIDGGATATDNCDSNLTTSIEVTGFVNTLVTGTYRIRYNVSDSSENAAQEVSRTVTVQDNCPILGQEMIINLPGDVQLVLVQIPAGAFQMGRYDGELDSGTDEEPQHEVTIAEDFWMGKFEVTQQQWLAVMESWPAGPPSEAYGLGDACPAYGVSWDDAQAFAMELNAYIADTGQGTITVRLPSEAEWEYAARAGTTTRFHWGDDPSYARLGEYAWYASNSDNSAQTVGLKKGNAFGLYDMAGNLWEWCEDDYHSDYTGAPTDGAAWVDSPRSSTRIVRGGARNEENWACRLANRLESSISRYANIGFRIAADVAL